MWTLETFYHSQEWRKLVDVLRMERTTWDGIICEECGKPITRKFDCIAHHKIFLTEENVNNAEISLNPANIALLHAACHNHIHNKLGYIRKEIYLVYGPPLAGKSSYIAETAQEGDFIISLDNIWQSVTGRDRYTKPARLNSIVFGVRDFLMDCMMTRRGRWNNCYIVGGFPLISERERIIRDTGAREVFIDTPKEECFRRIETDEHIENKSEWRGYVEDWFAKYGRA